MASGGGPAAAVEAGGAPRRRARARSARPRRPPRWWSRRGPPGPGAAGALRCEICPSMARWSCSPTLPAWPSTGLASPHGGGAGCRRRPGAWGEQGGRGAARPGGGGSRARSARRSASSGGQRPRGPILGGTGHARGAGLGAGRPARRRARRSIQVEPPAGRGVGVGRVVDVGGSPPAAGDRSTRPAPLPGSGRGPGRARRAGRSVVSAMSPGRRRTPRGRGAVARAWALTLHGWAAALGAQVERTRTELSGPAGPEAGRVEDQPGRVLLHLQVPPGAAVGHRRRCRHPQRAARVGQRLPRVPAAQGTGSWDGWPPRSCSQSGRPSLGHLGHQPDADVLLEGPLERTRPGCGKHLLDSSRGAYQKKSASPGGSSR